LKKPGFKKNNSPVLFFLSVFLFFYEMKQVFVIFLEETQKHYSELFVLHHAKSPFSELHNYNFLYILWHSNLRVKKCTPSLFSQSVIGQFTPKWQACTQQTEKSHSHTNSAVSRQIYAAYMP